VLLLGMLASAASGEEPAEHVREEVIKAKIMNAFSLFVTWPNLQEQDHFRVCLYGENAGLRQPLEYFFSKSPPIQNRRPLLIQVGTEEVDQCEMLFITSQSREELNTILARTRHAPVLTFSDTAGYGQAGVLINFYVDGGKVRYEVNRDSVVRSALTIDVKALSFARIIRGDQP
jgi:hypothetical protein